MHPDIASDAASGVEDAGTSAVAEDVGTTSDKGVGTASDVASSGQAPEKGLSSPTLEARLASRCLALISQPARLEIDTVKEFGARETLLRQLTHCVAEFC